MRLAVCILHYGDENLTRGLHTQFLEADPDFASDVFVLDNAAPKPYPGAWKRLEANLFWGGALAWALDAFGEAGYTHLWFCNNDALFASPPPYVSRALLRIKRLEKQGRVGLYSPAVTVNPYHKQMAVQTASACRKAAYLDGIAPVINLACAKEVGGADLGDNPYGYGVDIWLSLRAAKSGWSVWVDDLLVLRHKYHCVAKEVDGFLAVAAEAENIYLTKRLGANWREALIGMQTWREETL